MSTTRDLIRHLTTTLLETNDIDAVVDAFFATGFVSHNTAPWLRPGIQGVKRFFAEFRDGLSDIDLTVTQLVCDGDAVAVSAMITGVHSGELFGISPTGRRIAFTGISIVAVADGKIVEHRGLTDTVGVLRQLSGL